MNSIKEREMLTPKYAAYPTTQPATTQRATTQPASSYGQNVGRAALALVTALLAFAPVKPGHVTEQANKLKDWSEVHRLANQFELSMPAFATELRQLASQD